MDVDEVKSTRDEAIRQQVRPWRGWAFILFAACAFGLALLMAFAYGLVVVTYQVLPFRTLIEAKFAFDDLRQYWKSHLGLEPARHLLPRRHPGNGVTLLEKGKASPGLTLLSGMIDGQLVLRLIDLEGNVIRQWPVNVAERFTKLPAGQFCCGQYPPRNDWEATIQGAHLLSDGSVIFSVANAGLVRLDQCGKQRWVLPIRSHHSVSPSLDGTMVWVPTTVLRWEAKPEYPLFSPPFEEQFLTLVAIDGQIVRSISVLEALTKNDLLGNIYANGLERPGNVYPRGFVNYDITHLNSIKVLSADEARFFPSFATGDLLVSLRNLDLIFVLDPDDQSIKWVKTGPWLRQHDPLIKPDGTISVFDNRLGYDLSKHLGGSRIVTIDPVTREVKTTVPTDDPRSLFYSSIMGAHQLLANGNLLITESEAGRAFEITPAGEVVWEFVAGYDDNRISILTGAIRYSKEYLASANFSCPQLNETSRVVPR